MATATEVTLRLDSAALFRGLRDQVGDWRLSEHEFDPARDELRMSYDSGGSGRVALTVVFELDAGQMTRLLMSSTSTA